MLLTSPVLLCWTEVKYAKQGWSYWNIWRENQNQSQNARFFVISHSDLAVNRIVHFGTGSHCFLLTKTRCLLESPQSYSCSTWKRFDWRDSNHATRSRLVFISMLANTKCPGNGNELKNGNDFRNANGETIRRLSQKTRMLTRPEPKLLMLTPKVKHTWKNSKELLQVEVWKLSFKLYLNFSELPKPWVP